MRIRLFTYPLICLLLAAFIVSGALPASTTATPLTIDRCCDTGSAEPQTPAPEGQCNDPGCRCPSCHASLVEFGQLFGSLSQPGVSAAWFLVSSSPSDYISSIDYPPELRFR